MKRTCGECTLCCKLLPVRELDKGADTRCCHQRHGKGCAVYRKPGMPISCHLWSCRWLIDEATAHLSRPDRSHYVIDVMPDYITAQNDDTGYREAVMAVQIWVDPGFPDAHRDPALRAYLETLNEAQQVVGLVRYGSRAGLVLLPPQVNDQRIWVEHRTTMQEQEHTLADLAGHGIGMSLEFSQ